MPSFFDLMKYARTGIASPDMTGFDKLRARAAFGGYPVRTITGVPPISFKSDGTPLTAWSIAGNGQQTGTPTPDAPIMPEECGDRAANLVRIAYDNYIVYSTYGAFIIENLSVISTDQMLVGFLAEVSPSTDYNVSCTKSGGIIRIREFKTKPTTYGTAGDGNFIGQTVNMSTDGSINASFTTTSETTWVLVCFYASRGGVRITNIMLNTGSTALPYEPYGYKIPITCAGQTVPVYLGQTQTVRRIKKLVLDGTESWQLYPSSTGTYGAWQFYVDNVANGLPLSSALSNIAGYGVTAATRTDYLYGAYLVTSGMGVALQMVGAKDTFPTITSWKSYLAQQYAAGTPVTVWYVLATPETAIVNEPLCKIGDYADELHSTDAGVTIPTVRGSNTLTVDTELPPSAVSVTGHIKSS